ncbi:hypothetical protein P7K49_009286 [Saguinus oedipus]|uniref:Uncharacterized protein n=1 Tax=Saguinus oedipus TaxID=9490 RepID=A0ABQ9VK62_SAGOE|nr:hypothetical protein P7K49_009286 [Saguinus oedipus]
MSMSDQKKSENKYHPRVIFLQSTVEDGSNMKIPRSLFSIEEAAERFQRWISQSVGRCHRASTENSPHPDPDVLVARVRQIPDDKQVKPPIPSCLITPSLQPEKRLLLKEVGLPGAGRVSVIEQLLDEVRVTARASLSEELSLVLCVCPFDESFVQCCVTLPLNEKLFANGVSS